MNIPSQRGKSEHLGDKSEKELNKEFIALQKWVDQIPENEESEMELHERKNTSKYGKYFKYRTKCIVFWIISSNLFQG